MAVQRYAKFLKPPNKNAKKCAFLLFCVHFVIFAAKNGKKNGLASLRSRFVTNQKTL